MRTLSLIFIFCVASIVAIAQNTATVKGTLVDSVGKQSLKDASITVLNSLDSTLEVFSLAKADGSFVLNNVPFGNMILKISFQGYSTIHKNILFSDNNKLVNLDTIYLQLQAKDLGNVTVTEAPIRVKKDTVEFNAGSFKTKPNAVVEDLLKKLPGVDVDKNGSIKAQGENVQRILVDGKRFFGNDPKMATKNLPPDVIDKIQVFDDLSDQSKFTGFDDGNRVKTINITTKKNTRKGYFGKTVAGAGTDGNYDESFNMHRFNGEQQISILGQANDINKQNFTQQDILGSGGGGRGRGGSNNNSANGSGITTTWAGGANFRNSWGSNIDAYGSYFYNDLKNNLSSFTNTVKPIGDSSQISNATSNSFSKTPNHRINLNFEDRIDSNNSFIFRPNITFQKSEPNSSSSSVTQGVKGGLINSSVGYNSSINNGFSISGANMQFRHRFAKKYRTISADANFSANENNGIGNNYSINSIYPSVYNSNLRSDTLNQYYVDTAHSFTINPTISFTEPVGKNQIIELRYSFSYSKSNSINNTYQFNNSSKVYDKLDSLFSNSYRYTGKSHTATLSYRLQKGKANFNIGSGIQFTGYTSNNTTKNVVIERNFINLTPTANFTYAYSRTKNLRIFYSGRTGQPSVAQLQPITTTSDNINFQLGNPDLKQQFTHSIRALFTSFDPVSQHVIFATINASTIVNDIQSAVVYNIKGGKTAHYVNLNGTYNVAGYFNYGIPLKKPKSNLNFTTNISYGQSQTLQSLDTSQNYLHNYTKNTVLGQTIKWTTNLKDNFDMNFSSTTSFTISRFTLNPTQNANYITQNFDAEFTYYTHSGWIVASEFNYTYYGGNRPAGYNASIPLINPSIAKQLFKKKSGELRLTCFDLLNQNTSVVQSASNGAIVNTRTNVLKQYFMLTFTFNLRNFNSPQQRMPGMFRGNRPPGMGDFRGGGFGGGRRSDN